AEGCGRKKPPFPRSIFRPAPTRGDSQARPVDAQGQPLSAAAAGQAVETTYRLADVLQRGSDVSAFFGTGLDEASNGLNVEGLAVAGGKLFVGLRAPSLHGKAYILG